MHEWGCFGLVWFKVFHKENDGKGKFRLEERKKDKTATKKIKYKRQYHGSQSRGMYFCLLWQAGVLIAMYVAPLASRYGREAWTFYFFM